jgi:O-antigen ligase/Flp pilus assembly protein TadD
MRADRASSASLGYLLKEAGLFLLFAYLLVFANNWYALSDYNVALVGVVLLWAASLAWLGISLRRGGGVPAPLSLPLLTFLAVYLLTALTSMDPRRSLDEVWFRGAYVFGFALTAALVARGWPRELFVKALLIAGTLLGGVLWTETLRWYAGWLEAAPGQWLPGVAYRLPLASGVSIFLNLLLMLALARLWAARSRLARALLALWIASALVLQFLTSSRGGWLGTAMGFGVLALIYLRDAGGATYLRGLWQTARRRPWLSLGAAILGGGAMAVVAWVGVRQLVHPEKESIFTARRAFWGPAWQTFLESPLVGQGPLTFGSAYLRHNSIPPQSFYPHAHSVPFNLLAETGIVGVAAFGWLAASTFRALWGQVNRLRGEDRAAAVGALGAAATFVGASLVETAYIEPFNSVTLAVLLGAALAGHAAEAPQPRSNIVMRWRIYWPVVLGLILAATGVYRAWRIAPLHAGVLAANAGRWEDAAEHFAESVRRDPRSAIAHEQYGLANSVLAAQGDPAALDRAAAGFAEAARLDPDWWLHRGNLGALHAARGDDAAALRELEMAVTLAPRAALAQLNLGMIAEQAGALAEAEQAYARTLDLRPDWADAYFWRATPLRARTLAEWRTRAAAAPEPTVAELEAAAAQGADRAPTYTQLAEAYLNGGRTQEVESLLLKAALATSFLAEEGLDVIWLKAELAAAHGDGESAIRLGEQALEGYRQQSVFGRGAFGTTAYGPHLFRQERMRLDLAPQFTPEPFKDRWVQRLVRLGEWHAAAGNAAQAGALYREALALAPDNGEAAEVLQP